MSFQLVLGTWNEKKRRELELLLNPYGIILKSLQEFPEALEVEETGSTFEENATLKATVQARRLGQWVLGEDSGLCVQSLKGAPGVYSARYAGTDSNDQANNQRLLQEMEGIPLERRSAFYVCQFCLADPTGIVRIKSRGECHGRILAEPRGDHGFGYDPLFEIPEYHQTFAELGDGVKSVLSHRAKANRLFIRQLLLLVPEIGK
jgi:XTP/dITP diphosphohydrolase